MRYSFKITCCLVISLLFLACGEEEQYTPSGARVNFRLELHGRDSELNNLYSTKLYTSPRNGGEYVGISGLLVFTANYDNIYPSMIAYDLCCPNENNPMVRISPTKDRTAVCERCKSVYDLTNAGVVLSGPSKKRLWNYKVDREGATMGFFRIHN